MARYVIYWKGEFCAKRAGWSETLAADADVIFDSDIPGGRLPSISGTNLEPILYGLRHAALSVERDVAQHYAPAIRAVEARIDENASADGAKPPLNTF